MNRTTLVWARGPGRKNHRHLLRLDRSNNSARGARREQNK